MAPIRARRSSTGPRHPSALSTTMFVNSPKRGPLSRENGDGDLVANGSSDPFTTPPRSESGQTSPSASSPSLSTPAQDPFQGGSSTPSSPSSPSLNDPARRHLRFSTTSLSGAATASRTTPFRRNLSRRTLSSQSIASLRKPHPSTKLRGEIHKPWLKYPDPAQRWARILFWSLFALGFAASAVSEWS